MDTPASEASLVCRLVDRSPPRWVLLVLLCLALVVRGRYVVSHVDELLADPDGYGEVASCVYEQGTFGYDKTDYLHSGPTTVNRNDSPTATRPPLYPLVLAAIRATGATADGALHVVLGVLTVWGTWYLGRLWHVPPGACVVAAALVAIDPILLAHSTQLMTETLATLLAVFTMIALTCFAERRSVVWAMVAGLSAGLGVLCRPEFLPWAIAAGLVFPWLAPGRRRLSRLAIYAAAIALTVAPWGIRNYRVFGRPVITTTHGGFTLLLANNPRFYEYLRSAPWGSVWDGMPVYQHWRAQQRSSFQSPPYIDDEVANDRWAYREAFKNIRAEPLMFAYSCLVRVGRLWNVLPHQTTVVESTSRRGMRYSVAIFYAFEFALAAVGACFLRGKLLAHPWVWGTLLVLSVTAVHAFFWTDMRMRAPLSGVVALAAAYGLSLLACPKAVPSAFEQAA
jgi:hypothetical protein